MEISLFDFFIGAVFAWALYFAYICGVSDCNKDNHKSGED